MRWCFCCNAHKPVEQLVPWPLGSLLSSANNSRVASGLGLQVTEDHFGRPVQGRCTFLQQSSLIYNEFGIIFGGMGHINHKTSKHSSNIAAFRFLRVFGVAASDNHDQAFQVVLFIFTMKRSLISRSVFLYSTSSTTSLVVLVILEVVSSGTHRLEVTPAM